MFPITFQKECDVLICGSTLYALDVAIGSATAGKKVVVAMERTNPFIESIGALRSHIDASAEVSASDTLTRLLAENSILELSDRLYFNPHQVAKWIEDRLIEAGVSFYYNAMPVSALKSEQTITGAVFGGKPGLFAIEADRVFDCTLSSVIAKTAGVSLLDKCVPVMASYSMELNGDPQPGEYTVSHKGISGKLKVHRFYADFDVQIDDSEKGPLGYAKDFVRVYDAALNVLDTNQLSRFRGADTYFHSGHQLLETENGKVAGEDNLFVCGPLAIPGNGLGQLILRDPLKLHRCFPKYLKPDGQPGRNQSSPKETYRMVAAKGSGGAFECGTASFKDPIYQEPGASERYIEIEGGIHTIEEDVVIAGCGTSGVGAAYHYGRLGGSPLVIDNALEVGGTNTIGGVTNLWFGRNTKAFKDLYKEAGAKNDGLNASPFFRALKGVGGRLLPFTPVCGTDCSGNHLDSVYVITPDGLVRIRGQQFVDATGDGSLAAWSGADYAYGSERDGIPSWGSFGNFATFKPEAIRQFLSVVDERSAKDATRFIVAMRRCKQGVLDNFDYVHPAFYIAPRTARHTKGDTTVTYLDMLAGRKFRDGILRAGSNIDTKGTETSDAFKVGFYPHERLKRFEVTIPYSSLIPSGFKNLIVVGKAYSITNDALTMARMQRDLFVLGMVAAEAVQLSRQLGSALPDIPVETLQNRLIKLGALNVEDISADNLGFPGGPDELVDTFFDSSGYEDSLQVSAQLAVLGKDAVLPIIKKRDYNMTPQLARLLCFWGVPKGIDFIKNQLDSALAGGQLPLGIYASDYKAHNLPDHGFAPLPVLFLNNLALTGDSSVPELISKVVNRFDQALASPAHIWAYAFGIAYAAERVPSKEVEACLAELLCRSIFDLRPISAGDDLRECADIPRERLLYLRLCLARALMRCGSTEGAVCLVQFLNESRASFAVNARNELMAVTGEDFGYDQEKWSDWLHSVDAILKPTPVAIEYR